MPGLAQDFDNSFDAQVQTDNSSFNQLILAGYPASDKGMILTTTDVAGVPDVPAAAVTTKWQRYLWRRVRATPLPCIIYRWDPNATSHPTYLKWIDITVSFTNALVAVANIAALKAYDTTVLNNGQLMSINGYTTNGDGGEGLFYYDSGSSATADNGSIIQPTAPGTGRYFRLVLGDPKAEWFGAVADGLTDCKTAIQACLDKYDEVNLQVGTYILSDTVGLASNYTIRGKGIDKTIVKMQSNAAIGSTADWISAFEYYSPGITYADNVQFYDLTIDLNAQNRIRGGYKICSRAVMVQGGGLLVSNVKATNFCAGMNNAGVSVVECFLFWQSLGTAPVSRAGARFIGCEAANLAVGDPAPEIEVSIFNIYGQLNQSTVTADHVNLADNGEVSSCYVHDMHVSSVAGTRNRSLIHVVSLADTKGARIVNNTFRDIDGTCVYRQNYVNYGMVVSNNYFGNVWQGVSFLSQDGAYYFGNLDQNISIHDNTIILSTTQEDLFGGTYPAQTRAGVIAYALVHTAAAVLDNIVIKNNYISGSSYTDTAGATLYPRGVFILENSAILNSKLFFADNLFNLPSFNLAWNAWARMEGVCAIVIQPEFIYDQDRMQTGNNRKVSTTSVNGDIAQLVLFDAGGLPPALSTFKYDKQVAVTTISCVNAYASYLGVTTLVTNTIDANVIGTTLDPVASGVFTTLSGQTLGRGYQLIDRLTVVDYDNAAVAKLWTDIVGVAHTNAYGFVNLTANLTIKLPDIDALGTGLDSAKVQLGTPLYFTKLINDASNNTIALQSFAGTLICTIDQITDAILVPIKIGATTGWTYSTFVKSASPTALIV